MHHQSQNRNDVINVIEKLYEKRLAEEAAQKKNRNRHSLLEPHADEILRKMNEGYSFERISQYLFNRKLINKKISRTTVSRFVIRFFDRQS